MLVNPILSVMTHRFALTIAICCSLLAKILVIPLSKNAYLILRRHYAKATKNPAQTIAIIMATIVHILAEQMNVIY